MLDEREARRGRGLGPADDYFEPAVQACSDQSIGDVRGEVLSKTDKADLSAAILPAGGSEPEHPQLNEWKLVKLAIRSALPYPMAYLLRPEGVCKPARLNS